MAEGRYETLRLPDSQVNVAPADGRHRPRIPTRHIAAGFGIPLVGSVTLNTRGIQYQRRFAPLRPL